MSSDPATNSTPSPLASEAPPAQRASGASPSPDGREAELVADAARGNRAAWASIFEQHKRMVHAIMLVRVGSREAEDLTQDVFVKAMRRIATLGSGRAMSAWLAEIARNRAIDYLRWRERWGWLIGRGGHEETRPTPANPAAPAGRADPYPLNGQDLLRRIRGLPSAYHEPLVMRLVAGMSGPHIAKALGMTEGSTRVNLSRGMAMLKESLGKHRSESSKAVETKGHES